MWRRINRRFHALFKLTQLPMYLRLVFLYSTIVFFILLVVSLITITSVHYIMNDSIKNDLLSSASAATTYLDQYKKVDTTIFYRSNLQPFTTLQIYDASGRLLLDNTPSYTVKQQSDRFIDERVRSHDKSPIADSIHGDETTEFAYYQRWTDPQGKSYYLRLSHKPERENSFVSLLAKQFVASILISLVLTILSGMYLTKKSLEPLTAIRKTLQGIEVNKLGSRITLTDEKDEIHDLAVTINQTLERIEYGYKQQQQFISDASHELRTPITVIMGYVDMLDRWGKEDQETLNEGISAIKMEADYMRSLIERLLFFARSSRGTLTDHFAIINTADLLQEIYSVTDLIANGHTIELTKNEDAQIYADPGSVKQMLRIFIDNALKYTPDGGTIFLSCETTGNNIYFKILDTGIGIPKADLPRIFDRFYRVDSSRTKATGGSGLGLSIAKYIAKENHATLSLDSVVNQGTTVTVTFPRYTGEPETTK